MIVLNGLLGVNAALKQLRVGVDHRDAVAHLVQRIDNSIFGRRAGTHPSPHLLVVVLDRHTVLLTVAI